MINTENKKLTFSQKLSDSVTVNWLVKKIQTFVGFCINNAYRLFFMFLVLGLIIQPILFGAEFSLYGFTALFMLVFMLFVGLSAIDNTAASNTRRLISLIVGCIAGLFMVTTYSYIADYDEYVFNKEKVTKDIIYWNPLFENKYPDIQARSKCLSFEIVTKQGDFEITHSCTAYIDTNTWILFHLDEQKLTSFLCNDAKERLIASLNECRLDQVSNMSKTLYYSNGKFVRAKIE